jgi:hypothetical protein
MKYWLHPSHSPTKLEEKDNEIQNLKQQMVSMQQSHKDILGLLKDAVELIQVLKQQRHSSIRLTV